ncbi:hypothetical protein ACWGKQ_25805 [Streptomyces sp. NPDC054770]
MEREELGSLVDEGVLLTSRALAAGWPRRTLFRRLEAEGWGRVRAGAWTEPGARIDRCMQLKATQLLHPKFVVSHRSAARLWQIETLNSDQRAELEFTDPELGFRQSVTGIRVHRVPVAEAEIVERRGLRVTDVPRTLADLLRAGPRDDAVVAVESALGYRRVGTERRAPLTAPAAVSLALEAPLRGAGRAQTWLSLVDRGSGSPAETVARLHMHDAGLRPETQAEVRPRGGSRRYLDFLFRAEGLAVEIEGYAYHGTREAHRRDVSRFNQILQCPEVRRLLRFTAEDVFHRPAWMITEIHTALATLARLS